MTDPRETIAVIGMGYVGLPLAVAFAESHHVIGYDSASATIRLLQSGTLPHELATHPIPLQQATHLTFTEDAQMLREADIIILCVPTPVYADHTPDFSALEDACRTAGTYLKQGATVIIESTVAPGTTEKRCIPILEDSSGYVWKKGFFVGYSPERVNPRDTQHTLRTITKLVAGDTPHTTQKLATLYACICPVHTVSRIAVAEASKIMENTQRDLNIALANEMAQLFREMEIPTREVIEAAATKWNFAPYFPGLVGGHCISVDPYYLMHEAAAHGFSTDLIKAARARNEGLAAYIAGEALAMFAPGAKREAIILGVSYKANTADTRNSKSLDLIRQLEAGGVETHAHDPHAHHEGLRSWGELPPCPLLILTVAHSAYQKLGAAELVDIVMPGGVIMDIPSLLDPADFEGRNITLWQL